MRAGIILAAGLGSRLLPLTAERPKCLVEVGGRPVLLRALEAMSDVGVERHTVVAGYCLDQVRQAVMGSAFRAMTHVVESPSYETSGTAESLGRGLSDVGDTDDVLVMEGDVVVEREVMRRITAPSGRASLAAVAAQVVGCTGTFVRVAEDGRVREVSHASWRTLSSAVSGFAKLVNVHLFLRQDVADLRVLLHSLLDANPSAHVEHLLAAWLLQGGRLYAVEVGDLRWWEVDDVEDLKIARRLFPWADDTPMLG